MAGHSQFKNIMHRKGKQDAVRSKLFAKLAREITTAAKSGTPDPTMNARLRLAVQAARAENMPKDNIERAIKKAAGGEAEAFETVRYEGYGPGGVAIIVEALSDNRNRTGGAVRAVFTKHGGNLGATGRRLAHVQPMSARSPIRPAPARADAVLEAAIEAGADDVQSDANGHLITCAFESLGSVAGALEDKLGEPALRQGGVEAEPDDLGRRGEGRLDPEADRRPRGRRRRAERVLELRGVGRGAGEADCGLSASARRAAHQLAFDLDQMGRRAEPGHVQVGAGGDVAAHHAIAHGAEQLQVAAFGDAHRGLDQVALLVARGLDGLEQVDPGALHLRFHAFVERGIGLGRLASHDATLGAGCGTVCANGRQRCG